MRKKILATLIFFIDLSYQEIVKNDLKYDYNSFYEGFLSTKASPRLPNNKIIQCSSLPVKYSYPDKFILSSIPAQFIANPLKFKLNRLHFGVKKGLEMTRKIMAETPIFAPL